MPHILLYFIDLHSMSLQLVLNFQLRSIVQWLVCLDNKCNWFLKFLWWIWATLSSRPIKLCDDMHEYWEQPLLKNQALIRSQQLNRVNNSIESTEKNQPKSCQHNCAKCKAVQMAWMSMKPRKNKLPAKFLNH